MEDLLIYNFFLRTTTVNLFASLIKFNRDVNVTLVLNVQTEIIVYAHWK